MPNNSKKKKNLLLIGGTGFTGSYVLQELLLCNFNISLFVRDISKAKKLNYHRMPITIIEGNLDNKNDLTSALLNQDILVCIASLGFGHLPIILESCPDSICKAIFISTTGIFTKLNPSSKKNTIRG